MSLLLKDRVYTMEAPTAKRGVYPLHGYKLGLYRLPIKLEEELEIQSVHDGLKNTFDMDMYADRIFATYSWTEENMSDKHAKGYEKIDLSVTVEIVTGEVVDIIYQIFPIDKFGDAPWIKDYKKKADHFAKMITDTILRNTILSDKMVEALLSKTSKILFNNRIYIRDSRNLFYLLSIISIILNLIFIVFSFSINVFNFWLYPSDNIYSP